MKRQGQRKRRRERDEVKKDGKRWREKGGEEDLFAGERITAERDYRKR